MHRRLPVLACLAALTVAGVVPADASAPPSPGERPVPRTATVLPTLAGGSGTVAAVNDRGLLVGSSDDRRGTFHAVTWRRGELRRLPGLAPGAASQANDVDDAGRVVGMALDATGRAHAVVWRHRRIQDLGVTTAYGANATAVSGAGVVATGWAEDVFSGRRAYWRPDGGPLQQLDVPAGASADAVNAEGTVVGTHSWRDVGDPRFDEYQAYALVNGVRHDLGTLGGPGSTATDVNATDVVVGTTGTATDALVSFVWRDGTMTRLRDDGLVSPSATAVNDTGVVVGVDGTTSQAIWWAGPRAVPRLLPEPRRTVGASALDVSGSGVVVGFASRRRAGGITLVPVVWR